MISISTVSPVLLPPGSHLNGTEGLRGEDLGHPQLKVETKAVEESPGEDGPARPEPQRRDAVRTERGDQLVQHVLMFTTEVVIHIPATFTFS